MINIAIDMGSSYITIYRLGNGIALREPSVVALEMTSRGNVVKHVGIEAKKLDGKNDENTAIVYPIVEGCIKNVELTTKMLKSMLRKVAPYKIFPHRIHAIMLVPMGLGGSELQAYYQVAYGVGITRVDIIPSILASDIGNETIFGTNCHACVNMGSNKTEIAIIRDHMIISGYSVSIGGKTLDEAIVNHMSEKYNLKISSSYAENIKHNIGSLYDGDKSQMEIVGYDMETMEPKNMVLTSSDLYSSIAYVIDLLIKTISATIKVSKPDVINEVTDTGIILCGGSSNLSGIGEYMKNKLNIDIHISESGENATILGAGRLLNDEATLNKMLSNN